MRAKSNNGYSDVPTEHVEQAQFVLMVQAAFPQEISDLLFAIPNGGARHIRTALNLKAEGVRAGVPDLFFAYPHNGYNGLFIEMKRRKGGHVSDEQKHYIRMLIANGYAVEVCRGCDEAFNALVEYLGREK